ncbi:MAG: diaminopimelate epimerase [Candidatus Aminicenantes bacterium RBG_13_59_9]|nr:MAG: diaminopimelate epimerase [Candidatus Aminicenantes bacterium RBG_13_59_9]
MKFVKAHSLGNDFLFLDAGEYPDIPDIGGLALKMCDRHTGVGADGLLLIWVVDKEKGVAHFRIFNADGSEPETSGNGLRCAAACLYYQKKILSPEVSLITRIGQRDCRIISQERNNFQVRNDMGTPMFASRDIPFDDGRVHETIIDYPLAINQKIYPVTLVSVGNPHCAVFVDSFPARIEWHQTGREIESHPFFPNRINIEFIRVINRGEIEVLFWERGVGETLSSGSGSCAAAVASILKDKTDRKVTVRTSMGNLIVDWEADKLFQSGPAEVVFEGALI